MNIIKSRSGQDNFQRGTYSRRHGGNKWIDLIIYDVNFLFLIQL